MRLQLRWAVAAVNNDSNLCTEVCSHKAAYGRQRIQKRLLASVLQSASLSIIKKAGLADIADRSQSGSRKGAAAVALIRSEAREPSASGLVSGKQSGSKEQC